MTDERFVWRTGLHQYEQVLLRYRLGGHRLLLGDGSDDTKADASAAVLEHDAEHEAERGHIR